MEQMINKEAPVLDQMAFGTIQRGFVRDRGGAIYYAAARGSSGPTYIFPVLTDGSVSNYGAAHWQPYATETVEIIHPENLALPNRSRIVRTDRRPTNAGLAS